MNLCLSGFPVCRWYCLVSLMAASFASEPPERSLTVLRSPGATDARRRTSSRAGGVVPWRGGAKARVSSWAFMASMTRRLPWPMFTTNTPDSPSRYSRPWSSQKRIPSARVTMNGSLTNSVIWMKSRTM